MFFESLTTFITNVLITIIRYQKCYLSKTAFYKFIFLNISEVMSTLKRSLQFAITNNKTNFTLFIRMWLLLP